MQIQALLNKLKTSLDKISSSAQLDAEILLSLALKKDKNLIYTNLDRKITKQQLEKLKRLLRRRLKGEPIAYITKHKEFYGLDFFVNKNVLVPRPETEILVEKAINYINKRKLTVIDVGTGSGCIAVSLAKECLNAKIYASDISRKAISIARKNAHQHKTLSKINFRVGNLLPTKIQFDVILANLPYLRSNQIKNNLRFEPRKALFGGKDGTLPYQSMFSNISKHLAQKYFILIEIDPSQIQKLKRIIVKKLDDPFIKVIKDYSGQNRFVQITSFQIK